MKNPKMILFDYGNTLVYEPYWDYIKGEKAVFKHLIHNSNNITPEQVNDFSIELFNKYEKFRQQGYEPSAIQTLKYKYEYFKLEFDTSYEEIQKILWDNASQCYPMHYIEDLLEHLNKSKIRTGIISNIGWTGDALKNKLDEVLPDNNFEFIIASSDYGFRKPNAMLFDLALKKAGLKADDVWYCGDSIENEVNGAHNLGIFPVLYENEVIPNPYYGAPDISKIDFKFLHIHCWKDLIEILSKWD